MSNQDAGYNTEYKSITVRTTDGSTINGKVNISPDQRVSDLFTRRELPFIVMVDVVRIIACILVTHIFFLIQEL